MSNSQSEGGSPPEPWSPSLEYLARALVKYQASDLHLKVGRPPLFRIGGRLVLAQMAELTEASIESILASVMTEKQKAELEAHRQIDLSFKIHPIGRFRCSAFYQRGTLAVIIRLIPIRVPEFSSLGLPPILKEICNRPRGLVLITGATGSGKSTTLAAMVQHLNATRFIHILSIEDPIEFVYDDQCAAISQREVGSDTASMREALVAGLRHDPDVILLGEIRDRETITAALTAAETGHLVLTTLHTNDAKSSIMRILDVFREESQNQVRQQLADSLVAVVSQQLIPREDNQGQVLACEILFKSPVIENFIRNNELHRIQEAIDNSQNYYQMCSMNQALEKLVKDGMITAEVALGYSYHPEDLKLRLSGVSRESGYAV